MKLDMFTFDFIINDDIKITSELLSELMKSKVWHQFLDSHNIEMKIKER